MVKGGTLTHYDSDCTVDGVYDTGAPITVPVGEFASNDSGSVVVWDSDAAKQLFEALRTDSAIPQQVLDAQP